MSHRAAFGSSIVNSNQSHKSAAGPTEAVAAAAVAAQGLAPAPPTPTTAAADPISPVQLRVKIGMAASSGKLDLSECGLRRIPDSVWDLTGLEVCLRPLLPHPLLLIAAGLTPPASLGNSIAVGSTCLATSFLLVLRLLL